MAWLRRKGEQSGFELLSVEVNPKVEDVRAVPDRRVTGLIELTDCGPPERCKHTITVVPVLFEGHLRITDAEKFLHDALLRGVGPGKAYGMGLLSIAPARR
jgi:CRISPR system Cascade subunit CasE